MSEKQLLIKPKSLGSGNGARSGRSRTNTGLTRRSTSPIGNSINFWSSLEGLSSKYEWMPEIFNVISESTGDNLSDDVYRFVELCLEKFADNYLASVYVDGFEPTEFGYVLMYNWYGLENDDVDSDDD